jgi:hypothetical protein
VENVERVMAAHSPGGMMPSHALIVKCVSILIFSVFVSYFITRVVLVSVILHH